jgi:hypothetical protein
MFGIAAIGALACSANGPTYSQGGIGVIPPTGTGGAAPANGGSGASGTSGSLHGGTWQFPNGGEYGRVGRRWLDWQLEGDDSAKTLFVGVDCELCTPPSMWVVKKKMLD